MQADVDPGVRRAALKKLFADPRFNVMDGLDTYIDDYSKPDPLPEGWLEKMTQVARLGDYQPPKPEEEPADAEVVALDGAPMTEPAPLAEPPAPVSPVDTSSEGPGESTPEKGS
jgi:hypothetical protein